MFINKLLRKISTKSIVMFGIWLVVTTELAIFMTRTRGYKAFGGEYLVMPLIYGIVKYLGQEK